MEIAVAVPAFPLSSSNKILLFQILFRILFLAWVTLRKHRWVTFAERRSNNPSVHLKSVRKTWARALKTAKLELRPIYDLRATFASRLSAAGEPDNFVAGMLGHSSTTSISILPIYAKVVDEFLRGAIQKLETLRNSHSSDEKQANSYPPENRKPGTNWVN